MLGHRGRHWVVAGRTGTVLRRIIFRTHNWLHSTSVIIISSVGKRSGTRPNSSVWRVNNTASNVSRFTLSHCFNVIECEAVCCSKWFENRPTLWLATSSGLPAINHHLHSPACRSRIKKKGVGSHEASSHGPVSRTVRHSAPRSHSTPPWRFCFVGGECHWRCTACSQTLKARRLSDSPHAKVPWELSSQRRRLCSPWHRNRAGTGPVPGLTAHENTGAAFWVEMQSHTAEQRSNAVCFTEQGRILCHGKCRAALRCVCVCKWPYMWQFTLFGFNGYSRSLREHDGNGLVIFIGAVASDTFDMLQQLTLPGPPHCVITQ